jgi:uncharacterized protein (DUF58 family)
MQLRNTINIYYKRWLRRRMPASTQQILTHRNIFIFPSKVGFAFLLVALLLWLLGTNYQNNLVIVLAFLLLSLLHTCIFYTYANFSGLCIQLSQVSPSFAGGMASVTLQLKAGKTVNKTYDSIKLGFPGVPASHISVSPGQTQTIILPLPVAERGWYMAPRLNLSTVYPLGIMRAWSYLDMDIQALVYPQQVSVDRPVVKVNTVNDDGLAEVLLTATDIADDLSHLREYQQGDPFRQIAWKAYAKGQGLVTKAYDSVTVAEEQQWLDWDDFAGMTVESRLSRLCYCVVIAAEQQQVYGLRLPNRTIGPGTGAAYRKKVLKMLALYGKPETSEKERS